MEAWLIWLIISILLLMMEMLLPTDLFLAMLGIAGLLTTVESLVDHNYVTQIIAFCVFSVLTLVVIRPLVRNAFYSKADKAKTGVKALIDKEGLVSETINNSQDTGRIKAHGDNWRARSIDDSIIEEGQKVIIKSIESVTVYVQKID